MASRARSMLGVEINLKEIRVVQMSGAWPNMQVVMADSVATPTGAMQGGRIVAPELAAVALRGLLSRMRVSTKDAVVGIASRAVMARVVSIPRVPDSEIQVLLTGELEHYHILREGDGVFDYTILAGQSKTRVDLSVLLMAAEDQMLSGYREFASQAGLRLLALEPILLSMYRAAYPQVHREPYALSLAVSSGNSEIAVTANGEIGLYRRIAIGDEDLLRGKSETPLDPNPLFGNLDEEPRAPAPTLLSTPEPEPPPLQSVFDSYQYTDEPFGYGAPVNEPEPEPPFDPYPTLDLAAADRLATDVERSLDYYRRENPQAGTVERVFLTLETPELEPLVAWLSERLSLMVTPVSLPPSTGVPSLAPPDSWRFLGAAGLALQGLPGHPSEIPQFDLTRRRKQVSAMVQMIQRKVVLSLAVTALLALLCLGVVLPLSSRKTTLEIAVQADKQSLARKQAAIQERIHTQTSHQEEIDSLRAQTIPFAPVVDAVVSALDPNTSLTNVNLEPTGKILVTGEAMNEQAIVNSLNGLRSSPYFDHPNLDSYHLMAAPGTRGTRMQFQVSAPLAGNPNAMGAGPAPKN